VRWQCAVYLSRIGLRSKSSGAKPRNLSFVRAAPRTIIFTLRFFKRIGRKGAQARIDNSTEEQRREWAKKAAAARWRKDEP
jgi:hypothetical protein